MATKSHKKRDDKLPPPDLLRSPPPPLGGRRAIRITDIRSAKRLLARVLLLLQKGAIEEGLAKTITYVASNYVTITRDTDLEERMERVEELIAK